MIGRKKLIGKTMSQSQETFFKHLLHVEKILRFEKVETQNMIQIIKRKLLILISYHHY